MHFGYNFVCSLALPGPLAALGVQTPTNSPLWSVCLVFGSAPDPLCSTYNYWMYF